MKFFQGIQFNSPGDLDIGVITSLEKITASPSGYRLGMIVRSKLVYYDVTEDVYDMKFSPEYGAYPCLGEYFFTPVIENGIVTRIVNVNDLNSENNPITTGLSIGTYAMFSVPIDENTPRLDEIVSIENNIVTIDSIEDKPLTNLQYYGNIPKPYNGLKLTLFPDADIYTWDWGLSEYPFARCSAEEAKRRGYPDHFSVGSLDDIKRGCYWLSFYSTRGNEDVCDMVNIFLNRAPGWE